MGEVPLQSRTPLSSDCGTYKTAKARIEYSTYKTVKAQIEYGAYKADKAGFWP